jgi:Fe(3+) dicitrate transport protein
MIVTGSLGPKGVPVVPFDAVGSRDVYGPEEVKRTGARDLNDLLGYLPSISTRPYNGGEASAPNFSIHGLPDDGLTEYLLTLIDGVPASPLPYGWTAYSFFPLMTEQVYAIDLIRGGQSVRYSPNTVGGVLNLITAPIPDQPSGQVQSTYGSNDYISTLLSYGAGGAEDFGWLLTVGDRRGEGYRQDGEFDQQAADLKLRWETGAESWIASRFSYMTDTHQAPGGLTQAEFEQDPFGNSRPDNSFDGFRWVADAVLHAGDEEGFVEPFAWVSQTHRELDAERPPFGTATDYEQWVDDTYVAAGGVRGEQKLDLLGTDHAIYWGVRAQEELLPSWTIDSTPLGGGPSTRLMDSEYELTAFSAHVDDTLRPLEALEVTAGVRAEWIPTLHGEDDVLGGDYDNDLLDVFPAFGASYELTDRWVLFGNWQQSFRSPQVWGFELVPNPADQAIDFEVGESYELGTRALGPSGLSGSLAWWHTDFDNVGVFDTGVYENIGRILADGIDVELEWEAGQSWDALSGFSLRGAYTWQDSELAEGPFEGNQTPYAWEDKASWSLQYLTPALWRTSLGGVFVGESFSDEANTVPENSDGNIGLNASRTIWDAQVEKTWKTSGASRISLAFGATNVFDEDWFVHSRGGFFGGGKVAGPPRQLYVRLSASF